MKRAAFLALLFLWVAGATPLFALSCGEQKKGSDPGQQGMMGCGGASPGQAASKEIPSTGNKICPVSSDPINEGTKATYEYNGKIYNFCCSSCIDEFKKEPEKYIKKAEEELQAKQSQQAK